MVATIVLSVLLGAAPIPTLPSKLVDADVLAARDAVKKAQDDQEAAERGLVNPKLKVDYKRIEGKNGKPDSYLFSSQRIKDSVLQRRRSAVSDAQKVLRGIERDKRQDAKKNQ